MDKALRHDQDKLLHDLISPNAINELAKVLTFGAKKYARHNWRNGMKWSRVIGSLKRHLNAIENSEDYDNETSLLHAAHVMCNAMFLIDYYKIFPEGDDRPHRYTVQRRIGLDIDEVLCDFTGGWSKRWNNVSPRPTSWQHDRNIMERFDKMRNSDELDSFYMDLEPLMKGADLPFEPTVYITHRPVETDVTIAWLDKHDFPRAPVITTHGPKSVPAKYFKLDIFVDDSYSNFIEMNNADVCTFLWDTPHNQRYDVGFKRIKSLKEIG